MTLHSIDELLRVGASAAEAQDLIETLTVLWARGTGREPT
jgi:hypothetical protein